MASKDFVLEIFDDDIGGDNPSLASFDSDAAVIDDDFAFGDSPAAPVHDQDEITFAQDDEPPSDPMDETVNIDDDDEVAVGGYDDFTFGSSPAALQGFDDYIAVTDTNADYVPDAAEGYFNDATAPSAKRVRTTVPAPPKPTQPAHFYLTTQAAERSAKRVTIDGSRSYHIDDDVGIAYTAPSRVPGSFGRINREKGSTLPAYHKKVSHELDSDDELILAMRDKGYSDKQIADRLAKESRVRYDAKSISTRIQRIKVVQAVHCDFELENGIKEWKLEDDQLLLRAYDLAGIEIAYEIERLRAWRFKKTAEWMRRLNKDSAFSGKACHKRYSALMDGTATIPCDVDDNPAARHAAMQQLRQELEDAREKAREEKEAKEAKLERIKEEAQARQAQISAEKAKKRLSQKMAANERATEKATKKALEAQHAEENFRKKTQAAADKQAKKTAREAERRFREEFSLKHFKHVTEDTPDPRRVLNVNDLCKLCRARNLEISTRENGDVAKSFLLQRLKEADDLLNVKQLTVLIKARNIPVGGNKAQMKYQLALFAACSRDSYVQDDVAADGDDEADGMGTDSMVRYA